MNMDGDEITPIEQAALDVFDAIPWTEERDEVITTVLRLVAVAVHDFGGGLTLQEEAAAEARGREQGRQEAEEYRAAEFRRGFQFGEANAVLRLRVEAQERERRSDAGGNGFRFRLAADFLESTGGQP